MCEDEPGALHVGPGACRVDGTHTRRWHALGLVGLTMNIVRQTLRILCAVAALTSVAFVLEAGHRWF